MLRPLYILKRLAVLALGVAFAAGAQTQPSKNAPQAPAKNAPQAPAKSAPTATAPAKSAPQAAAPAKAPSKSAVPAKAAPTATAPAKSAAPAKAPSKSAVPAKAAQAPKPAAPKPAVAQKPSKPAKAPAKAAEKPKKEEVPTVVSVAHRRDPFLALISTAAGGAPVRLPPGKAGLQVSTVRVDGVVRSQNGMIVVATSPQGRTYFLHQGDRLFDGRVEQISMDAVTFLESGKDPFGKPIERTVVKRIYPSAGEQQ